MFNLGDGGVGFQLMMSGIFDAVEGSAQARRQGELQAYASRVLADRNHLAAKYNELLAYAQELERTVTQRDEALARTTQTLTRTQGQLEVHKRETHQLSICLIDTGRELEAARDRAKAAGSQLP